VLPSPIGGNISRALGCLAVPVVACVLWPDRRWLLAAIAVPVTIWQWNPAMGAITTLNAHDPSTRAAYYQPLVDFLTSHDEPPGRVEVVPTRLHWEVHFVAPRAPLARGWERQLDTANNPLFYKDPLTAADYQRWLRNNGVRYIALPDAPLDYAAEDEAELLRSGLPGLQPVWSDRHWQVFEVSDSAGIVEGPGRLVRLDGDRAAVRATGPGTILLRVRYDSRWTIISGDGCLDRGPDGWIDIVVRSPGAFDLGLRLLPGRQTHC
jgi:hypothetical protein